MRRLRHSVRFALVLTLLLGVVLAGCGKSAPSEPSRPEKSAAPARPAVPAQPGVPGQPATPAQPPAPVAVPAQPASPAQPPTPETAATAQPPAPVAVPEQPAGATEAPKPAGSFTINFKDATLDAVLTYLASAAGYIVIKDAAVSADTRVTVIGLKPLNADEAVELLNSVLKEKGYAAWKSQLNGQRILKVGTLGDIKKRPIPVHAWNDPSLIPVSDEVVTNVITLRYTDAVKLKQDLTPLISESGSLASNAATNTLILTDTCANVRRIVEIVQALDTHVAGISSVQVFQLKFADATSTATLITNLFKPPTTTTPTPGFGGGGRFGRFMMAGGGGGGGAAGAAAAPTEPGAWQPPVVTAAADTRTNTVVVSAPPETLRVIADIIKALDANSAEDQDVFVYPLENARAVDIQPWLNNLFGTATGTGTSQTRTTTTGRPGGAAALPTPGAGLLGQVYVVADTDTNALLVMTLPKYFVQVKAIIKALDTPVPQVLIKVLIAQVTHSDLLNLGAEFSAMNLRILGNNGQTLSTTFPNMPTSGMIMGVANTDFTATLAALRTIGKVDVLSDPYILGSDSQTASILVGFKVPFVTDSRTDVNNNVTNTISYQNLGITFKVVPHIGPTGLVTMDITPEIDTLDTTFPPVFISTGVTAPVFDTTTTTSRVVIQDGQTIVIGGLMQDQKTDNVNKVPLLGDIPWIGALFRSSLTQKQKTELLIFITPNIATKQVALLEISKHEEERAKLVPDAVGPGVFQEHLQNVRNPAVPNPGATTPAQPPAPVTAPAQPASPTQPSTAPAAPAQPAASTQPPAPVAASAQSAAPAQPSPPPAASAQPASPTQPSTAPAPPAQPPAPAGDPAQPGAATQTAAPQATIPAQPSAPAPPTAPVPVPAQPASPP